MHLELLNDTLCVTVACVALLSYDYLLTVGREVDLIWSSKLSPMKILFFLTRYLVFIEMSLSIPILNGWNMTVLGCRWLTTVALALTVIGIVVAEMVFLMRTFALWGRGKHLAIALCVMFVVILIPAVIIESIYIATTNRHTVVSSTLPGCFTDYVDPIVAVVFILIIILETLLTTMTLFKAIQYYRAMGSITGLLYVLSRDGLLFYLYTFAISFINFVFIIAPSTRTSYATLLTNMQRSLHAIFSWRVILNLREADRRNVKMGITHGQVDASGTLIFQAVPSVDVTSYSDFELQEVSHPN